MSFDNNPKGYKLDTDGLIQQNLEDPILKEKARACFLEMRDVIHETLKKHFLNDPLSPALLNKMMAPLYTAMLGQITDGFPTEVKEGVFVGASADLGEHIAHIITEVMIPDEKMRRNNA